MPIRLALSGALGRMGLRVRELARGDDRFEIVQLLDVRGADPRAGEPAVHTGELEPGAEVLIDFSTPAGFASRLVECVRHRIAFVSGTTGLQQEHEDLLVDAASVVPVLHAPNMSLGVEVLRRLVETAARVLPESFDVELSEIHHRKKVDAPSGTAVGLLALLAKTRGEAASAPLHGRSGAAGPRGREIGVHAVRGGDVVGEHTVLFLGDGERIEITHRAGDRAVFARGALEAAVRLAGAKPGRYGIADVLSGSPREGIVEKRRGNVRNSS